MTNSEPVILTFVPPTRSERNAKERKILKQHREPTHSIEKVKIIREVK